MFTEFALPQSVSLYIHIPYCRVKCDYCDFYSVTDYSVTDYSVTDYSVTKQHDQEQLCTQIIQQLEFYHTLLGKPPIQTVYLGGGTPSVLDKGTLDRLLEGVNRVLTGPVLEWSVEVNPESLDRELLRVLNNHGVNRVSLGIQSFSEKQRKNVGRICSSRQIDEALSLLKSAWQGEVSLDLMSGFPGQTLKQAVADMEKLLSYRPHHISFYALTLEQGTPLFEKVKKGRITLPEEELAEKMWIAALEILRGAGYVQYEVSNFCLPGKMCRHNLNYWKMKPYLGCGPAAVSTLPLPVHRESAISPRALRRDAPAVRMENPRDISLYLAGRKEQWNSRFEILTTKTFLLEYLMMGFRLRQGIKLEDFYAIFGRQLPVLFRATINRWQDSGLLLGDADHLALSSRGLLLLNRFLLDLMEELEHGAIPEIVRWS